MRDEWELQDLIASWTLDESDWKLLANKQGLLFALAEAAVEHPDDTVRAALFPVVPEVTLRQLVQEAKANERIFQQRVRKVIQGSYSSHYRRMLPKLLHALEFRCPNTAYRPVMDALELLEQYIVKPGQQRFYPAGERVPLAGVVPDEWRLAVVDEHGRIERIPYELCVLRALRDALRRREIYVEGARAVRKDTTGGVRINAAREAVDRRPAAREAAAGAEHRGVARRDRAAARNDRPARRAQRGRPRVRVHAQAALGRVP
jgi:hypothetical protein